MVNLLLQHGADANAPGRCGTLPLDRADVSDNVALIQRLEQAGGRRAHKTGCG